MSSEIDALPGFCNSCGAGKPLNDPGHLIDHRAEGLIQRDEAPNTSGVLPVGHADQHCELKVHLGSRGDGAFEHELTNFSSIEEGLLRPRRRRKPLCAIGTCVDLDCVESHGDDPRRAMLIQVAEVVENPERVVFRESGHALYVSLQFTTASAKPPYPISAEMV